MSEDWTISWVWWITAVEVPVLGCLFWLIHHGRRESEQALLQLYREIQGNLNVVLDNLAQSKLEVARLYATLADLKDVEQRLTDHLLRLEARLTFSCRLIGVRPRLGTVRPVRPADQPRAMEEGMQLECAVAVTSSPDSFVEHLASRLLALAGDQSVRTVEALAAVLTNQEEDDPLSVGEVPPVCSAGSEVAARQEPERTEQSGNLSLCRRIARRAAHRSLLDPTGGANAFHRIDASPSWSRRSLPVASFGSFLFYRL